MKSIVALLAALGVLIAVLIFQDSKQPIAPMFPTPRPQAGTPSPSSIPNSSGITLLAPPKFKVLNNNDYHIFQSFNNCGPASLSMALSYFGINVSQKELGDALRPYQIASGDNDDKSTTLEELAAKGAEYGLIPFHRPLGNPELVKLLITYDIPVITRTWTKPNEDIGHYRLIKGFDDNSGEFIQDDSLQGKNLRYTYGEFDSMWKQFSYEYLALIPPEKEKIAKAILGQNADYRTAWSNAVSFSLTQLEKNPSDIYARFNLSVAYFNTGEYQKSVNEFEKVENQLPFRTLWYQIEPIEAYFELGNYNRVFQITDKILNNHNKAFSELYILRGKIYQAQGNSPLAREEFRKAVLYNKNLQEAKDLLND